MRRFLYTQRYKSSIRNPSQGLLGVGHTPVAVSPCVCPVLLLFPRHLLLASVIDRRWGQHDLLPDPAQLIIYSSTCKCPWNKLGRDSHTFCSSGANAFQETRYLFFQSGRKILKIVVISLNFKKIKILTNLYSKGERTRHVQQAICMTDLRCLFYKMNLPLGMTLVSLDYKANLGWLTWTQASHFERRKLGLMKPSQNCKPHLKFAGISTVR